MKFPMHRLVQILAFSFFTAFAPIALCDKSSEERFLLEQKLMDRGVSQAEAKTRVQHLSDEEVSRANAAGENLPAGEDSTITIGVGTAILIAILLIVLL